MKKLWKPLILAAALTALCIAPAHALEYNIDAPDDYLLPKTECRPGTAMGAMRKAALKIRHGNGAVIVV